MTIDILVLGDGTGGLVVSNLLAKQLRQGRIDARVRLIGRLRCTPTIPAC